MSFHDSLTDEDKAEIEKLRDISPDEATEMYTKLRIALDLLSSVSTDLKFAMYRKRIRVQRHPDCAALACELDQVTLVVARFMDDLSAKRPE